MKIVLTFTVISIALVISLVWHFMPQASMSVTTNQNTQYDTQSIFDVFKSGDEVDPTTPEASKGDSMKSESGSESGGFFDNLNAWKNEVVQATSADVTVFTASSTSSVATSTYTAPKSIGSILTRMSEQFRTALGVGDESAGVSDEEMNNLFYYSGSVDFKPTQYVTSEGGEDLRNYGNALATKLTTFRIAQGDQLALLSNFFENSTDAAARDRVKKLSDAYSDLSAEVAELDAPQEAESINTAIANALSSIAAQLNVLANAQGDTAIYNESLKYNATSASLAKATLRLIDAFSLVGVRFKSYEPGSIFMFK